MYLLSSSRRQHFALVYIKFHLDSRLLYQSIKTIYQDYLSRILVLLCGVLASTSLQLVSSDLLRVFLILSFMSLIQQQKEMYWQNTFLVPVQIDRESFITYPSADFNLALFLFHVFPLLLYRKFFLHVILTFIFSTVPTRLVSL